MIYAGVGARITPADIINKMIGIGLERGMRGDTLRSGGAMGADSAFAKGCSQCNGKKEIYTAQGLIPDWAMQIAKDHHPAWERLSSYVQKLMGRNVLIVLGKNKTPVDEVICWTPRGEEIGGTGHTMRVANHFNIPIINLYFPAT